MMVYACATAPGGSPNPSPSQPTPTVAVQVTPTDRAGPGGQGALNVPLTDSARRVRDSTNAVHRDSAAAFVLRSIAGHENEPAESVFKNIKIFKGVPAARLVNIMNNGFGRSLGVSCGFCHVRGKFDSDEKQEKNTARIMVAMVEAINRDYLSKVPTDNDRPPSAGCFTCHRGNPRPMTQEGPPPGSRPPAG
jgi:hypothetical protein